MVASVRHPIGMLKHFVSVAYLGANGLDIFGDSGRLFILIAHAETATQIQMVNIYPLQCQFVDQVKQPVQGGNKGLSSWLMSRKKDEYAIKIEPTILNSWDFSARMDSR